jgi:hypothetical protein
MPTLTYIQPLDQPFGSGSDRAIEWIRSALRSGDYSSLRMAVAYAKQGALARLELDLDAFRTQGGTIDAILGFDQAGTSSQALRFALDHFDSVKVWQHPSLGLTFHPKLYIFEGAHRGEVQIGSCNLTAGGLEANCESAVRICYLLPAEQAEWLTAILGWTELSGHPNALPLDSALLGQLSADDLLADESKLSGFRARVGAKFRPPAGSPSLFPSTPHTPASPLPVPSPALAKGQATLPMGVGVRPPTGFATSSLIPRALLIQIVPHANGEVFLSKRATDQHPTFFGLPWTGVTTPKILGNPPYPQRVPDPVMEWTVFDRQGNPTLHIPRRAINTVLYTTNAEIRITVQHDLRSAIVPLSILQMEQSPDPSVVDYVCEVHPPGSPQFNALIPLCNQTMPSGGLSTPRRFGWI